MRTYDAKNISMNMIYSFILVIIIFTIPLYSPETTIQLFVLCGINILLAQSINLLSGFAGQISLGHAGFYAVGAYSSALLMLQWNVPFLFSVPMAVVLSILIGYFLAFPARRVREFYLAMMTLAFGFIIQVIIKEWPLTGGVMGLSGIPSPSLGNLNFLSLPVDLKLYYYLVSIVVTIAVWTLKNVVQSYFGRAFLTVQSSELAAASVGIRTGKMKQLAYTFSAGLAGLAGALYAHLMGFIGLDAFSLNESIFILVMAIVGGLGTVIGPILGAVVLTFLPHELQMFDRYQLIIYGAILVLSFLIIPKGLAGLFKVRTSFSKRVLRDPHPPSKNVDEAQQFDKKDEGTSQPLLVISGVTKEFEGVQALVEVSFSVDRGMVLGLIGPNGSGKSTLVNLITGIYPVSSGNIYFQGENITDQSMDQIARKGIIRTFQDPHNVSSMTVRENILVGAHLMCQSGIVSNACNLPGALKEEKRLQTYVQEIMHLCEVEEISEQLLGNLPYGIQRLAEVARAIAANPKLLILDEPAAGLSGEELRVLGKLIHYVKSKGVSVIVIDHHMEFITDLVDTCIVLDSGRLIYQGSPEGMKTDPKVREAYLGVVENVGA